MIASHAAQFGCFRRFAEDPCVRRGGINSSVVIAQNYEPQRFFQVSGKSEASSVLIDMRLQRRMGRLPVLVVGFGAGVTAGSFVPYPDFRSIVICELEPLIPPASDEFFAKENYHVLRDPRVRVVYDYARHYIPTTPDKFDVITTDPIHPWVILSYRRFPEDLLSGSGPAMDALRELIARPRRTF
jgi:hypothetical protein